ncbi:DNA repair protein HhH-GPD [Pandoraea thiooxydans]|uniref:DNA repair protein n=1 Tax=Pandoraea thiooxydans TaxID=445709 RepID=A0A0G3EVL1_9BURK|nr:type II toxin-antitoxin system HicB family antitoxin [Pandoraea thiooxydans]AKJ68796.1 DNA repair protein [Pandoraea thiooxydans]APR96260.1 DNA repair protein HhH-GPD [Pandoraea thiooxydans]
MKAMNYKGYAIRIEYSDKNECFVGHITGIYDVVGFHGDSVTQLHAAVIEAVHDYLATCEKLRRPPKKPYSGKFVLRVPTEMHSRMAMQAEAAGKSLNQWATEVLEEAIHA